MIDIIIPTYKNKEGLIETLQSIDWSNKQLHVTIVDDCSNMDYTLIQEQFPQIENWIYLPQNIGPGCARQRGIDFTTNPYLIFIDTGDYFISKEIQSEIINTIKNDKISKMFMWHFTEDGKSHSNSVNNHLHGKVYKREFLQSYNITFSTSSSYANEDIGFNRTCRMILKQLERNQSCVYLRNMKKIAIMWPRTDPNSLTLKDDGAFPYQKQNWGLAYNMIHTYNILKSIKIDNDIIVEDISDIMVQMYYSIICTIMLRPQYIKDAWRGAKIFYDIVYKNVKVPDDYIQMHSSQMLKKVYQRFSSADLPFTLNMKRFLLELDKNETPPTRYLTFNKN